MMVLEDSRSSGRGGMMDKRSRLDQWFIAWVRLVAAIIVIITGTLWYPLWDLDGSAWALKRALKRGPLKPRWTGCETARRAKEGK
jgi:uncharacterized membrane protein YjgN (DUF898 family)